MTSTRPALLRFADALDTALDKAFTHEPELLTTAEKAKALVALQRAEGRLAALRLRVMSASDDVASEAGARDAAAWLTHHTRGDRAVDRGDLHLGLALRRDRHLLAEAFASGAVNQVQAQVIAHALAALPPGVGPGTVQRAEEHLVAEAAHFGPRELRVVGRKVLEVLAPEASEAAEGEALEREERRARERCSLTIRRLGNGCSRLTACLPDAVAERLSAYLDAFTSPRHDGMLGQREADGIPIARRRGQAFGSFLEAADPARLPLHGGDATTVMVTIDLDQLRTQLAAAGLDGSERISAAQARRLACNAALIPAVLGGRSQVLDFGRARRLFSPAQRKVLALRDHMCRGEGCTVPAAWCEAHHRHPWSLGGRTDLRDGLLLCSWHHHRAHDDRYLHELLPNGDVRFARRR